MCDAMIVRLVGFQPVFALSINYCTVFWAMCCCAFVGVKKCLAKFVSFVERWRSLNFQEKKSLLLLSMLLSSCFFDFNYLFNISLRAFIEMYSG